MLELCTRICFCPNPKNVIWFLCSFQGASVLLMLNASMASEQQFRKGLIQYLKQFSGSNTNTDDLWNSLTQVCAWSPRLSLPASLTGLLTFSHNTTTTTTNLAVRQVELSTHYQNVSEMMSSWTSQKGFPLITVSRKENQVTLTQEHFRLTTDNVTRSSRWVGVSRQSRPTDLSGLGPRTNEAR